MALEQALEEHLCQENKQTANTGKNSVAESSTHVHFVNDCLNKNSIVAGRIHGFHGYSLQQPEQWDHLQ